MNIRTYLLIPTLALSLCSVRAQKLAGGDISMLPRYEQAGATYYTHDGQSISDLVTYSKQVGMNAMRVRLFVNPKKQTTNSSAPYTWSNDDNVCQDIAWVKALGKRIKDAGMKFMLAIHYSDTWADPAKQWTPEDWKDLGDAALAQKVYSYTADALTQLKAAGAEPDLVQTGNEISYGMLWGTPNGTLKQCWPSSTANWDRFAKLLKQATQAVRKTCPSAKIILHVERVSISQQNDNKEYKALTNFFNKMSTYGIDYDVIGLSYYPYFHGALSELDGAITKLEAGWPKKEIMVVETGYPYAWAVGGTTYDATKTWAYSDEGQKKFTDDLIAMLDSSGGGRNTMPMVRASADGTTLRSSTAVGVAPHRHSPSSPPSPAVPLASASRRCPRPPLPMTATTTSTGELRLSPPRPVCIYITTRRRW